MRKDVRQFYEASERVSGRALIYLLEEAVCEGVYADLPPLPEPPAHLFGRQCERIPSGRLSSLPGLAVSGIRTAAFLDNLSQGKALDLQDQLIRQHLPVLFHSDAIPASVAPGCFLIESPTLQDAVDWTLIGHKIAELALVPGLVAFDGNGSEKVALLQADQIREYLGEAEDWIPSPSPAQRLLFGKNRRRLPHWFQFDYSPLIGPARDEPSLALEAAARERFFFRHLPEMIRKACDEYSTFSGRLFPAITSHQVRDAEYVVLVRGGAWSAAVKAVDRLRRDRVRAGCAHINLINPFPEKELESLLAGKKAVAVLDRADARAVGENLLFDKVRSAPGLHGKNAPALYAGFAGNTLSPDEIEASVRNLLPAGKRKNPFYLGIEFTRPSSHLAQHEVLLHAISSEYPGIGEESLSPGTPGETRTPVKAEPPAAVRKFKDQGPPWSRISRFFHDTVAFYGTDGRIADPFQALPVTPPETAVFADRTENRNQLPVLDPGLCTGCGLCFVHCPHAALPPVSLKLENLLKAGMDISSRRGFPVASLTPLIKNLARLSGTEIKNGDARSVNVREFLPAAFEKLAVQMKLEGEKLETARRDLEKLIEALSGFRGLVTDIFFNGPESQEKGSGELFALAVNPQSCTACGVCVEVCPEDALTLAAQTPELVAGYDSDFRLWEQLPDTDSKTIERLNRDEGYDPFASLLLSRHFYQSMSGGSATEQVSPAKTLLHLVTALAESSQQPPVLEWVNELDELTGQLAENIHVKLAAALPGEDSVALRNALDAAGGRKVSLEELVGGMDSPWKTVDTALLQRKIVLESNLKDLRWSLAEGPSGGGRARYGMVLFREGLPPGLADYPFNPFNVPVLVNGEGVGTDQLEGLIQAQVRYVLDEVRLIRRARMEIKDAYRPEVHDLQIASLKWEDLEEKEKRLLPALLVVAAAKNMAKTDLSEWARLLSSDWPLAFLLLNDGTQAPADINGLLFSAFALRKPLVVQGGLGDSKQLYRGLMKGLQERRPAVFHLLAPLPEKHCIPESKWPDLHRIALETRAFPFLRFDPAPGMSYLSQGFSLKGNPEKPAPFASWLQTQRAWTNLLQAPEAAAAEQAALVQWNTWQELSGAISGYPDSLRAKTEDELKRKFETELDAVKAQYEAKLKEQEASSMARAKEVLSEKLMKLTKR